MKFKIREYKDGTYEVLRVWGPFWCTMRFRDYGKWANPGFDYSRGQPSKLPSREQAKDAIILWLEMRDAERNAETVLIEQLITI